MLAKLHRLPRREFLITKKQGVVHKTSHFSAIVLTGNSQRYSIVTSSKLHKHAVVRNRLRRQIYDHLTVVNANIILYPYKQMLNLSDAEISSLLNSFLSKFASYQPLGV